MDFKRHIRKVLWSGQTGALVKSRLGRAVSMNSWSKHGKHSSTVMQQILNEVVIASLIVLALTAAEPPLSLLLVLFCCANISRKYTINFLILRDQSYLLCHGWTLDSIINFQIKVQSD